MMVDTALNVPLYRAEVLGSWNRTLTVTVNNYVNILFPEIDSGKRTRVERLSDGQGGHSWVRTGAYMARNEFPLTDEHPPSQNTRTCNGAGEEVDSRI